MSITITAVGDLMFDRRLQPPRFFFHMPDVSTCLGSFEGQIRFPFTNTPESIAWLAGLDRNVHGVNATSHAQQSAALELPGDAGAPDYPFRGIAEELRSSPIVFGNLECPLAESGRRANNDMCYAASPAYAKAMAEAGFSVVSFANNHCFDFGEGAFAETLRALREQGIATVGAGATLDEARTPASFDVDGERVAFLAYSIIGPPSVFATKDECGVAPLNPMIVGQDIQRARRNANLVVLSLHWGAENRSMPWPRQIEVAHDFIDAGADVILGHHPHVPGAVEVYRGKPIFYSLGNFVFGHDHGDWGDDILVRLHVERGAVRKADLVPIRGRFQPGVTNGDRGAAVFRRIAAASRAFRTSFTISGGIASIEFAR